MPSCISPFAGSITDEASASYDVIFAMAVFRHGNLNSSPPPPKCDHRIHFADFEQSVTDLARTLKPDGLLVIQHVMFRLADTLVAAGFEPVFSLKLAAFRTSRRMAAYGQRQARRHDTRRRADLRHGADSSPPPRLCRCHLDHGRGHHGADPAPLHHAPPSEGCPSAPGTLRARHSFIRVALCVMIVGNRKT